MNEAIVNIAGIILSALACGLLFIRIGQTPIVGYIFAGIILGPSCFHFIENKEAIQLLSEFGVMFLLFAVGLNLPVEKIKRIWKHTIYINILAGIIFFGTFYIFGYLLHWDINIIIILTFCALTSSTAVTVKSLKKVDITGTDVYEYAMGITVLQDLIALLMIIAIKLIGSSNTATVSYLDIQKIVILVGIVATFLWGTNRYKVQLNAFLRYMKVQSEVLAIVTVSACLAGAVLSIYTGLSPAFGSFLAGLALGNSIIKEELQKATSILEETLLMAFFLSIGLLINVTFITSHILVVMAYVLFIMISKTAINMAVLRLFKIGIKDAFLISVLLGHLGEFSFVLINEGVRNGLLNEYSTNLLISITGVSLVISPFWLIIAERCKQVTTRIALNSSVALLKYLSRKELVFTKRLFMTIKAVIIFVYIKVAKVGRFSAGLLKAYKKRRDR